MKSPYLAGVVGAVLGLFAGWLLFSGSPAGPVQASGAASSRVDSGPGPRPGPDAARSPMPTPSTPGGRGREAAWRAPALPRKSSDPAEQPGRIQEEMATLRARLQALESELSFERGQRQEIEGEPRPMPEDLPPRFEGETARIALDAALREAGLEGEVTAADCSEFPCLLIGEMKQGPFGREQSKQVGEARTLAAYADDSRVSFGSSTGRGEDARHLFGVALYPKTKDEAESKALRRRIRARFDELTRGE